jgi:choline dehydrogenase-like flavoprotein
MQPTVLTSHALGGCPMSDSAQTGVVDEWGRVFRGEPGPKGVYRGLYIADGSVIPTALGVNPALTISAVALRVAEKVLAEWDQIPASVARTATPLQCKA